MSTAHQLSNLSPTPRARLAILYLMEFIGSSGSTLMTLGIFFYMRQRFDWSARQNFLLATAEGIVYAVGALSTDPISKIIGRRNLLRILHSAMAMVTICGLLFPSQPCIVAILLTYVLIGSVQWAAMESLICTNASPSQVSRRLMIYNLTWSGSSALTVALSGVIIAHNPADIFIVALIGHLIALAGSFLTPLRQNLPKNSATAHATPEPELLQMRTLAMQLSRVALPSTFALVFAIGAMMPTLPVIQKFTPAAQTVIASIWMASRFLSFIILGLTIWWHTRPRALLSATVAMLIAFPAITWLPVLPTMIAGQIVIGLAMGLIYSASLYFGMVLSEGSTAHGGYHEALIGLGGAIGPGAGAIAEIAFQGNLSAAVGGVTIILLLSVAISTWVSATNSRKSKVD